MQGPGPSPSRDESKGKAWQNKSDKETERPVGPHGGGGREDTE